jgi:PAS domain S-box-containing protein
LFLFAFRDLTARRRVEAQLRASERRMRRMADALPSLVSFVGVDERYRFVNSAYAAWAGWDAETMEGRSVAEVLGEELYARVKPWIDSALSGEAVQFTAAVVGPAGQTHPVEVSYLPMREGETVTGYFVVVAPTPSDDVSLAFERPPKRVPPASRGPVAPSW